MAEYVEARSLASLNALAANPPQYPVNPAGKRQDPLTLYISRVPGTRDVILSTFKPQIKNVSSQDVASSLYYVHLDAPEDELLVSSSSPPGRGSGPSVDGASIIPRKPVAGQAPPAQSTYAASVTGTPENISPSRTPNPVEQASHTGAVPEPASLRRPDQLLEPNASAEPPMRPPQPPIHRKPLGPRTPAATPAAAPEPANSTLQEEPLLPPGHTLPPRPDEIDDLPGASQGPFTPRHDPSNRSPAHSRNASATLSPRFFPSSRSPSPSKRKPFTPFSLTVIRRDPASGQQWNVGKVASFQLEHPEWIADEKYVPSPSISIHLETSGYNKFRGMPTSLASLDPRDIKGSLDIMRPSAMTPGQRPSSSPEQIANALAALAPPAAPVPHHGYHGFERQVKMGYGPSWTANIREAFRRLDSNRRDDALATSPPQRRPGHDRSASATSVGSFGGDFEGGDAPVITYPGPGLRPQGYVFQSPWGGRCEFRTGNGGRSLRCRHVLPNMGGGYNPLVDASPPHGEHGEHGAGGGRGGRGGGHGGSNGGSGGGSPDHRRSRGRSMSARPSQGHDISELRFNLPSSELFGGKDGAGAAERAPDLGRERMRDRLYNQMHNRTESDVDDDEYYETGHFSDPTSLGRERAGGGNRGKRAKMGKLIIAEEGLKMLDLVVAANVGIWWSVWERRTD